MAVFQTKSSQKPQKNFYAYYRKDLTRIRYKRRKPPAVTIYRENFAQKKFTGKEQDQETGLYYFGARYLDPKTSRWLSGDHALGDYLPVAPNNDDAKKHNQNLPGMGGVFNVVNLHVYHYAGNNPVKYVDPDGETDSFPDGSPEQNKQWEEAQIKAAVAREGIHFETPLHGDNVITSKYGKRSDVKPPNHDGIDLRASKRTPVYAAESGVVVNVYLEAPENVSESGSSFLKIAHGSKYESRYLHMDSFTVKEGEYVKKGQLIGYSGDRKDTKPHLHFEIRKNNVPKDPKNFINF